MLRRSSSSVLFAALVVAAPAAAQDAVWYLGTYTNDILVWDEASEQVVDRIKTRHFIPTGLLLNEHKDRLYVIDATSENIEVVDLKSKKVTDEFTLSSGDTRVRIENFAARPDDRTALLFVKKYTLQRDRYLVEGPFILEYDMKAKQVTDTVKFPDGKEREGIGLQYSPDGKTLYFFTDDIIAVNAETYEEIERWEISKPLEPGLGRASFGVGPGTYDEPGVATSLYRMRDPAQNRNLMGVAWVRLAEKKVDFFTVGDAQSLRGFALAPGGEFAYSILSEVGRYEFWEFDLKNRKLARRHEFAGRPRMGIRASADGKKLYIFVAGNTIDVYDRATFELLRTVTFDEDMTSTVVIAVGGGGGS